MAVDDPLRFDGRGRTAETRTDEHIRDLIEQVLFTTPGERVNRPDFGSGILQLVFAPNGDALAAAAQAMVQGALQRWLGELIVVDDVTVENVDAELRITVRYVVIRSQQRDSATFVREVPGR